MTYLYHFLVHSTSTTVRSRLEQYELIQVKIQDTWNVSYTVLILIICSKQKVILVMEKKFSHLLYTLPTIVTALWFFCSKISRCNLSFCLFNIDKYVHENFTALICSTQKTSTSISHPTQGRKVVKNNQKLLALVEYSFGQPMLISMPATSLSLKEKNQKCISTYENKDQEIGILLGSLFSSL